MIDLQLPPRSYDEQIAIFREAGDLLDESYGFGFGFIGGKPPPAGRGTTAPALAAINSSGTNRTFASLSAVSANEWPLISVMASGTSGRTVTGLTVGGQPATQLHWTQGGGTGDTTLQGIFIAPKGATGDVVITWSGSQARCACSITPVVGLKSSTPLSVQAVTAATLSIAAVKDGFVFAAGYFYADNVPTFTGCAVVFNQKFPGSATNCIANGYVEATVDSTVSVTRGTTTGGGTMIAVSFR